MKAPAFDLKQLIDDFRQLEPNDPGLWPMAPKIVILVFLLFLLVACAWWFDWNPLNETLEQKRQEEVKLKDEWLGKKKQTVNLEEYQKQLADIDRQLGALLKQLPNRSEMEALLVDVNQAGRGRGLQFDLWKPGAEVVKDFYAELPISLRVTGSYADLGSFAADVAKLPRIVSLRDVMVDSQGASGVLKMDATAVTYRYLDDEEVAKQRREKTVGAKK